MLLPTRDQHSQADIDRWTRGEPLRLTGRGSWPLRSSGKPARAASSGEDALDAFEDRLWQGRERLLEAVKLDEADEYVPAMERLFRTERSRVSAEFGNARDLDRSGNSVLERTVETVRGEVRKDAEALRKARAFNRIRSEIDRAGVQPFETPEEKQRQVSSLQARLGKAGLPEIAISRLQDHLDRVTVAAPAGEGGYPESPGTEAAIATAAGGVATHPNEDNPTNNPGPIPKFYARKADFAEREQAWGELGGQYERLARGDAGQLDRVEELIGLTGGLLPSRVALILDNLRKVAAPQVMQRAQILLDKSVGLQRTVAGDTNVSAFRLSPQQLAMLYRQSSAAELDLWFGAIKELRAPYVDPVKQSPRLRESIEREFGSRPEIRNVLLAWVDRLVQDPSDLSSSHPDLERDFARDREARRLREEREHNEAVGRGIAKAVYAVDLITDFVPVIDQIKNGARFALAASDLHDALKNDDEAAALSAAIGMIDAAIGLLPGPGDKVMDFGGAIARRIGDRLLDTFDRLPVSSQTKEKLRQLLHEATDRSADGRDLKFRKGDGKKQELDELHETANLHHYSTLSPDDFEKAIPEIIGRQSRVLLFMQKVEKRTTGKLRKRLNSDFEERGRKVTLEERLNTQDHHVIPVSVYKDHEFFKDVTMDIDALTNAIRLQSRGKFGIFQGTRHSGGHKSYNDALREYFQELTKLNMSVEQKELVILETIVRTKYILARGDLNLHKNSDKLRPELAGKDAWLDAFRKTRVENYVGVHM